MSELKPCPAQCLHTVDRGPPTVFQRRSDIWGVYCQTCHCSTEYYGTEAEAITAWNTRPQPSAEPVGDLIERAKARAMTLRWHEPIPVRVFVRDGCVIWSKVDDNNCNLTVENSAGMLYHAHSLFVPHTETPLYPASALEAARCEALEQAVEKLDGIYREMCGQHGADSGEAGAAFYARKTIYELKENPNAG